jgi:hypothetical protein
MADLVVASSFSAFDTNPGTLAAFSDWDCDLEGAATRHKFKMGSSILTAAKFFS